MHEEKPYKCEFCEIRFADLELKKKHEFNHSLRTFKCKYCEKKFATSYKRKIHKKPHKRKRSYPCKHCDKRFKRKDINPRLMKGGGF